jgi:hypothetical protein
MTERMTEWKKTEFVLISMLKVLVDSGLLSPDLNETDTVLAAQQGIRLTEKMAEMLRFAIDFAHQAHADNQLPITRKCLLQGVHTWLENRGEVVATK